MDREERRRRAIAALRALAVGDAMGAATEGYRPEEIEEVYDARVMELVEPVNLYPESAADRGYAAIGPVTRGALAAAEALAGRGATVEGEALGWAVAVGIATPVGEIERIVELARRFGGEAAGAAGAAVAAGVAAGVGGYMARDAVGQAALAAERAGAARLAAAIARAAGIGQSSGGSAGGGAVGVQVAERYPPAGALESVVAFAVGVAFGAQSVRRAVPEAVNQGGEASLTAAIAGALCGGFAPGTAVEAWAREVEAVNGLDLAAVADGLLALRSD